MARLLVCALVVLLLLGGCTSKDGEALCAYEATPQAPTAPRRSIEVPDDVLDRHPVLARLLADPGLAQGLGASVACDEGVSSMDDLGRAGADVRVSGEVSRDTYVRVEGREYLLNLGTAVHHD